jgi:hypothetical protein
VPAPPALGHTAVSLVKWESRADPFPGGAPHRISPATDSSDFSACFLDDEDTGGLPAGQQQARCLRDFPGHVASRMDAIFPERPCGRVLGAASSDRNVRNRRGDCGAVCRLPATRCFGGRLTHSHHSGGGLSSGAFARRRRESRGRYCCPTHCPWRMRTRCKRLPTTTRGTSPSGKHLRRRCLRAFSAAS